jgi:hypothetical protein
VVRRWWLRVCVGTVLLVLAGCGAGASDSPAPRSGPADTNPCALFTTDQQHERVVSAGQRQTATDGLGTVSCVWSHIPATQGDNYVGRLIQGSVPGGTPSASIVGLPTAQYAPAGTDPKTSCVYLVSISPYLTLWAQYINTSGDLPGLNHRVACTKAQSAAADMLSTYRLISN